MLRDAPTGSIVVECEYIPLIGDQTAQQQEEEEESGKVGGGGADDVLYDIPVTQLDSNAVLEDDDEHDDLLDDEEADGDGAGVWSWSEPKTQGGGGSGSGQQRKSEHAGEGGGVSTVERHDGAVGVLQVAGIQLRNLKPQAASLFSGAAVFYVQCSLGQVQKRTKAIEVQPKRCLRPKDD